MFSPSDFAMVGLKPSIIFAISAMAAIILIFGSIKLALVSEGIDVCKGCMIPSSANFINIKSGNNKHK